MYVALKAEQVWEQFWILEDTIAPKVGAANLKNYIYLYQARHGS